MADVRKASLDPDDPELEDETEALPDRVNPRLYWEYYRFDIPDAVDMVCEILYNMPPNAGKRWFKSWFKDSVSQAVCYYVAYALTTCS
jgi:hypothetical protein